MTKVCNKCKQTKQKSDFNKKSRNKDGLNNFCKTCIRKENFKYRQSLKANNLCYHCCKRKRAEGKSVCQKCFLKKQQYYNSEKYKNIQKTWSQSAKGKISNRKSHTKYCNTKIKVDLQFKLKSYLRNRLNKAIANNYKKGSAVRDLGCTIDEFKTYIENQFVYGMSWENWGNEHGGWHIDHIIPLYKFDLTDREQLLKACHYTNLRPLFIKDNLSRRYNENKMR